MNCPCGSNKNYLSCCGAYHLNRAKAETPEALMRSRYAAYSLSNIEYIKKTMMGKPLINFSAKAAEAWSKSLCWLGLKVLRAYQENDSLGFVEFEASYLDKNLIKTIHELSQFQLSSGAWFYVDGEQTLIKPKVVARSALCPCGSNKKFKNCHERLET